MKNKVVVRSSFKDIRNFTRIPELRTGVIAEAPETPINGNFAVNSTANFLHPSVQYLKVKQVAEINRITRAYILEPDTAHGTAKLAYFRPGQWISLTLNIGNAVVTRPYTLCSSPLRSVDDEYMIIVSRKIGGFASDYIFNNWRKGSQVIASAPNGNFYFQPLRDAKNIVGICDNRGFMPFLSMAESIIDKTLKMDLTLIYYARKQNEAFMSQRFDELADKSPNFRIIYVFSDENVLNCERGFVTKSLIEKCTPFTKYSLFVNGSNTLYNRLIPQISELKLENKYIRFGLNGQINSPETLSDFPQENIGKTFLCKVVKNGKPLKTIACSANESLLVALEREGIEAPSLCRSGECGFCRAKLLKGNVFIPQGIDNRRLADSSHGIIHPCCSYPMSDMTLVIQ